MTFVALLVFGHNLISRDSTATWHAVGGVVVFVGLFLALTVLAGTLDVRRLAGWAGRSMAAVDRLLPFAGLIAVAYSATLLQLAVAPAVALWLVFAVACLFVSRRAVRDDSGVFDDPRTAKVGVPAVLLLVVLVLAMAVSRSLDDATVLLTPTMVLAAFAAIAVLPAVSAEGAVKGLDAVRNRGERAVRFARRRPWLVAATAVVKLLVIVAVWVVSDRKNIPGGVPGSTLAAWVLASVAAVLVMVLFVLDRRFGLAAADHPVVSRASGLLLGGSLGCLVVVVCVVATLGVVVKQPLPLIGVAVLLALGVATGSLRGRRARLVAYGLASILAMLAAILVTRVHGAGGSAVSPTMFNGTVVVSVLAVGLAIGFVVMLVQICRTRRFAWLVHVAAVVFWMVFLVFWAVFAKEMTMLNVDVVLTLLMIVAAVLLALGVQRKIDAFEITVTLAVTFLLIEVPLIAPLLPYPEVLKQSLAAIALLTPGCAALWAGSKMLAEPSEQRAGMTRLAIGSLLYYLLLALVWPIVGIDIPGLINGLSGVVGFLAIPLVLLLVAAGESGARTAVTPAGRGRP
ncbi:MAG TPA: hypothetical protein VF477_15880 [Mycobacterium sp.]